jgi:hypothetical protein
MFLWVRMMSAFFESVDEFREQMRRHIIDELGDADAAEYRVPLAGIGRGAERAARELNASVRAP